MPDRKAATTEGPGAFRILGGDSVHSVRGIPSCTEYRKSIDADPFWHWIGDRSRVPGEPQWQEIMNWNSPLSCYPQATSLRVTKFKFCGRNVLDLAYPFDSGCRRWWALSPEVSVHPCGQSAEWGHVATQQRPWAGVDSLRKWRGKKAHSDMSDTPWG